MPAYLRGHLGTFAPRSYTDVTHQQPSGVAKVVWAYFGGVPMPKDSRFWDDWPMRTMTAEYRLPAELLPIWR